MFSSGSQFQKRIVTRVISCLALSLVLAAAAAFLTPNQVIDGRLLQYQFGFAILLVLLQVAAAWLFLSSLQTFSGRLRLAYRIFSAGMLLFGVAELQFSILGWLRELDSWWVSEGFALILFIISGLATYLSMRLFARILSVKFFATSLWRVFGVTIIACVLITLVPHLRITGTPAAEFQYDVFMVLLMWLFGLNLATAVILWRIRRSIGPLYTGAVSWLAIGMSLGALAEFGELLYSLLTPISLTTYTKYSFNYIPVISAVFGLVIAGAVFKDIARCRLSSDASYIDVIIYMEQLTSDPTVLYEDMRQLRFLTARLEKGQASQLSATDIKTITSLYQKVEDYLVTKESLRKFSRQELRALLPETFTKLLAESA